MSDSKKPKQIENLFEKIEICIDTGHFGLSQHAILRQNMRLINLNHILYVLRNGFHEKRKTVFDNTFNTWKYAIRGSTFDDLDIRIVVAFDLVLCQA